MAWNFVEGSAQSVDMADHAVLTFPDGDWFIAGWLYALGDSSYQYFVSWNGFAATPSCNLFMNNDSSGNFRTVLEDDDGTPRTDTSSGGAFSSATWAHLGIGRDGNTLRVYVNGSEVSTAAFSNFNAINHNGSFRFGGRSDGNSARYTTGRMAEWAKWNRFLTAGEREALGNAYSPAFITNARQWYVPMIRDFVELHEGLALTNNNSVTIVEHPKIIYPWNRAVISPAPTTDPSGLIAQAAAKAAQSLTGAQTFSGAVAQAMRITQQSATGAAVLDATGAVSQSIPKLSQYSVGASTETVSGSATQSLKASSQSITGFQATSGIIAQAARKTAQALIGVVVSPPRRTVSHRNRIHPIYVHQLHSQPELPLGGGLVIAVQALPLPPTNRGDGLLRVDNDDAFLLVNANSG